MAFNRREEEKKRKQTNKKDNQRHRTIVTIIKTRQTVTTRQNKKKKTKIRKMVQIRRRLGTNIDENGNYIPDKRINKFVTQVITPFSIEKRSQT